MTHHPSVSASQVLDRPLVIGASGLVGGALFARLRRGGGTVRGTWHTHPREGLEPYSTAADSPAFLDSRSPTLVVLASALTHVDYCETHPEEAFERNVEQLRPIALWCDRHRVPLVFFSTDYVFDGRSGPYDEAAEPAPLNVYGRTKLAGERIMDAVALGLVVRITNVFDIGFDDRNFLHRCVTQLRDRGALVVASDQLATPAYATWLADQLVGLIERGALAHAGSVRLVHAGCDDLVSRGDFARRVAERLGADPSHIEERPTSSLNQPARRPLRGGLRNDRWKSMLGVGRIALDDALDELMPRMRTLYEHHA